MQQHITYRIKSFGRSANVRQASLVKKNLLDNKRGYSFR
jgi:hypothetical protein